MKKILIPVYTLCAATLLSLHAFAYVDASSTTMVLSAVVAVVVAVAASVSVFLRKAKRKAQEVLHIDENANKIVEDEIVVTEPAAEVAAEQTAEVVAEETAEAK